MLVRAIDMRRRDDRQADRIPTWDVLSGRHLPHRDGPNAKMTSICAAHRLGGAPGGIEPPTPSLPSMRGWFTAPCSTSSPRTIAQVRDAVEGCVVGDREDTCGAVSGKPLARQSSHQLQRLILAQLATAPSRRHHGHAKLAAHPRGALPSSDDFGSSVEREAHGQVLWRVRVWRPVRVLNLCSCNGLGWRLYSMSR
jgi:hypothetical protein